MDEYREGELQDVDNGNRTMSSDDDRKRKNYRLIIDPVLEHGQSSKVYRFEGVIPGEPDPEPVLVADPRSRIKRYWNKKDVLDIPVPHFKHDVYYVGTILPKEVSFSNLNDNINLDFLINLCKGFGNIEDSKIYYHPKSKKHLGIGKVVFAATRSAKLCADKLNQTSRMGMLINAVVDPFGKERTKWINSATGEKDKVRAISPVQKRKEDPQGCQSKTSDATNTQKRKGEKNQPSRRMFRGNQKESLNNNLKSDDKQCSHNNIQTHDFHPTNYVVSTPELNNVETSDSENFQTTKPTWNDLHETDFKELNDAIGPDKEDQKQYERGSNCKHKDRDRRSRNNYDHHREAYSRHKHKNRRENRQSDPKEQVKITASINTQIETLVSDEQVVLKTDSILPTPLEAKSGAENETQEPRMQSLDSRIQSLLGSIGLTSPVTQEEESAEDDNLNEEVKERDHPPLPVEPTPPPPSEPPLPDEAAPPPLPPEPQPHYIYPCVSNNMETKINELNIFLSNGHTLNTNKRSIGEEDDRMSLSSLGSEEEKIEVNPPTLQSGLPPSQPPLPPLPPMPWQLPPPLDPGHNQAFQNQITNSVYSQRLLGSTFKNVSQTKSDTLIHEGEVKEEMFLEVLDQVINQLKFIMRKDLCKKMVQDTAFTTYDRWWTSEQLSDKSKPPGSSLPMEIVVETSGSGLNVPVSLHSSSTSLDQATGMSGTIEALFDNKDGSGFGVGGLLGLPGGIPKMPSFRKKFLKPLTPPPEEDDEDDEDEEHEFLGPRTPEESESERDKISDSGEESLSESELKAFKEQHKKKIAIYSTDSESDDEESEPSESDEEKETLDRSETDDSDELSDVDIETTSPQPPSPIAPPETSDQLASRQKHKVVAQKAETPEKEFQEIERATFPVLCEDSSEDDSLEDESFTSVKANSPRDLPKFGIRGTFVTRFQQQITDERTPRKETQLTVTDNSDTLQKLLEKKLEKQRQFAKVVSADHCYHFKDETKKRPRDPLPAYPQEDSDLTDSASEGEPDMIPCLPANLALDHQYCAIYHPIDYALQYQKYRSKVLGKTFNPSDFYSAVESVSVTDIAYEIEIATDEVFKKYVNRTKTRKALADVTNLKGSRELMSLLPPEVARKPKFKTRSFHEQQQFSYEFLYNGIDQEDTNFLKRRYDELLQDDSPQTAWLNNVHWVEHSLTKIPDQPTKKRRKILRKHATGVARTEGYYKISHREKSVYLSGARGVNAYHTEEQSQESILWQLDKGRKQKAQQMREARSESRRWQTVLSSTGEDVGDLVKFNQLKFRKKALKFAKSGIHDWGLFALEPIASDEMVIEYVGQTIRGSTADLREKKYEQMGIGSSYMFRIDGDNIIDATKCGNLARFINHSCMPNCYAKIISVEGQKKIVIYSKTEIGVNEEITYDYKFPLEDEKIPCLCGTSACRGSLN